MLASLCYTNQTTSPRSAGNATGAMQGRFRHHLQADYTIRVYPHPESPQLASWPDWGFSMSRFFAAVGRAVVGLMRWPGWRELVSRAALPMLALAASYGVYSFALLFVPDWVAKVQALAFELVYIGLAIAKLTKEQQKRARRISWGAVTVSIAYNSLDGLFHRRAALLVDPPLWGDVTLALLHGVPLAVLAYLVADLLLHGESPQPAIIKPAPMLFGDNAPKVEPVASDGRPAEYTVEQLVEALDLVEPTTRASLRESIGCSDSTLDRLISDGLAAGLISRPGRGLFVRAK